MIPPLIVQSALERGIDLIAITDHNTTRNVSAVMKAAQGTALTVLPGMELQTREEVHILCLFGNLDSASRWQAEIDALMPQTQNNPEYFGEQFIVDASGAFIRREEQLLLTSASITLQSAVEKVHSMGGLVIPAHVDRSGFGLFTQLAFVPAGLELDAIEISRHLTIADAKMKFPQLSAFPVIQGGDAHRLEEFLGNNWFTLATPTLAEVRLALRGQDGRRFDVHPAASPTNG